MLFNNLTNALRAFQQTCEQNQVFNKWPEDFEFVFVCEIKYQTGTITEENEKEPAKFLGVKEHYTILAQAKDYVEIKNAKDTKKN